MRYTEIIDVLQESAYDVAIKLKTIFPSRIIGICLSRYKNEYTTDDDIATLFNPFGVLNPSTLEKMKYSSLYEGIINGLNDNFIMDNLPEEDIDRLIKSWSLSKYDIAYLKSIDKIIIDLTDDQKIPFIDQYTIYKDNNVVLITSSLQEVLNMLEKDGSLQVQNSKGKLINPKPVESRYASLTNVNVVTVNLSAGTKVVCNGINMYASVTDTKPTRSLNGIYYIYDGKEINGRFQLCQKKIINGSDKVIPLGYVKGGELSV